MPEWPNDTGVIDVYQLANSPLSSRMWEPISDEWRKAAQVAIDKMPNGTIEITQQILVLSKEEIERWNRIHEIPENPSCNPVADDG